MNRHEGAFREAIARAGITPPEEIISDGKLHRHASSGKRGDTAGWYVLHTDGIAAGAFGDWRTGASGTWRADIGRALSGEEEAKHRARVEDMRRAREVDETRRHAEARARAMALWKAGAPAAADHPYLAKKRVQPVATLRELPVDAVAEIIGYRPQSRGERLSGRMLIAPIKVGDVATTVEMIDEEGRKSALAGGQKSGGYWAAQSLPEGNGAGHTFLVGEGISTVLSAREATGNAVVAALSCGNLAAIASVMARRYPAGRIVILADIGNGERDAVEAARAVGALLALPDFGADMPKGVSDFNDLARIQGLDAVRGCIASAKPVEAPQAALAEESSFKHSPVVQGASGGAAEYPQPKALPVGLPPVDAFIFELLPDSLRPWAEDICERVQCPPDFVGASIMTALGSVIGRKVAIRPQGQTDWTEYANQWGLVVGRPGVLKSPAMEAALAPLKRLAANAVAAHTTEMEDYAHKQKVTKLRQEAGEKAARAKLSKSTFADVRDDLSIPDPEEPRLRRYIANDTSYESLGAMLGDNPNGVLVFRDELVSLLKTLDREDNAGARGFYLTGWSGNSPYTFDRITRGRVSIPAVTLSLLGSTQPGRIAEYIRSAVAGGSGDDGLIQRFGILVWPDIGGEWREVDRWPDTEAKRQAFVVFDRLETLDPLDLGATQDSDFNGNPDGQPFLRFAPEALEEFRAWRDGLERLVRSGEEHPALESHFSKYRKLAPSLALVLHLANGEQGNVSKLATEQALGWIEYLSSHARRAYASVSSPETAAAKAIVDRMRRGEIQRLFAPRDIYRKGWAHLSDSKLVHDALTLLVDLDWLFPETRETDGRSAKEYTANPRMFSQ